MENSTNFLNLDGSADIYIGGVYDNVSWPDIRLRHKLQDGTPIELDGEWKFRIYPADTPDLPVDIVQGSGVEVVAHELIIRKPLNLKIPSGNHQFEILWKFSDEIFILYRGSLKVNRTQPWLLATS